MPISISDALKQLSVRSANEGLSKPYVTSAVLPDVAGERLRAFLKAGHHGDMDWMTERVEQRASPQALWPEAKSAIVFAQNYGQDLDALARLEKRKEGVISAYALNRDYHDIFKGKLKRLAQFLHHAMRADVKVFVDTAPLMEKPLAAQAGLGWQGKHTNLVSRELGSWFFIGTILTTADLPNTPAETDHCGSCRACLDICPTSAFLAAGQLNASRCISYLTIEHSGHIDQEFRKAMGNRIYGCDDCLAVCPWNKFAQVSQEAKLQARDDLKEPQLSTLLQLNDAAFRKLFARSPVKRTGRNRFMRNCLIAAGNSGDATLLPLITKLLDDDSPLVRAMAVWAAAQLGNVTDLRKAFVSKERDEAVLREWSAT
jgi:epoxyqueuosine reductase